MSIIPAFELGILNAWILMVMLYSAAFVPLAIGSKRADKRMEGEPAGKELTKKTRTAHLITHATILPFTLLFSIFVPIKLGTWWFYSGLLIYLAGLVMVIMSSIEFATAPLGQPMARGIYTISRHPSYFGFFLAYLGTGIACASWIFLLCAIVWIVSWRYGRTGYRCCAAHVLLHARKGGQR